VLYWSSERPVPTITIDYGDGRKLVSTITGNSVHYVLDSRGRPVDALPGLYGPRAFVRALSVAETQARAVASLDRDARAESVRRYLNERIAESTSEWTSSLAAVAPSLTVIGPNTATVGVRHGTKAAPSAAAAAGRTAVTKLAVEAVPLKALDLETAPNSRPYNDDIWEALAARTIDDARLDEGSRLMMRRHLPPEMLTSDGAAVRDDAQFDALVDAFEHRLAVDTLRNQFDFRLSIEHLLLADPSISLDALNRSVYDSVFLTPASDPWLGLRPSNVYTGLEHGGIVESRVR
jgi:hypothetical protein